METGEIKWNFSCHASVMLLVWVTSGGFRMFVTEMEQVIVLNIYFFNSKNFFLSNLCFINILYLLFSQYLQKHAKYIVLLNKKKKFKTDHFFCWGVRLILSGQSHWKM